ncbi:MAG: class I SAM-dependent methyltransferase [bacterium]
MKIGKRGAGETVFGNVYNKYESKNPIARKMMDGFKKCITSLITRVECESVVDIGCGEGYLTNLVRETLPRVDLYAFDLLDSVPSMGILDGSVHFHAGSVYGMPYGDGRFDLTIANEVLEHLEDYDAALLEMKRVTAGHCLLSVPNEPFWRILNMARMKYVGALGNTPGHLQHWGRRGFVELVQRHFQVLTVGTPFPWTVVLAKTK